MSACTRLLALAATAVALAPGCGSNPELYDAPDLAVARPEPDACPHPVGGSPRQYHDQLLEGRFVQLSRTLHAYQEAYEASIHCEAALWAVYIDTFEADAEWLLPALDRWVESRPDDYAAHAARGRAWAAKGFRRRGTKFANETSEEQFAGMRAAFVHAEADLRRAIELNPRHLPAHSRLIGLLEASRRDDEATAVYELGIAQEPLSYRLRSTRIGYLAPRWGGSYPQMEAFALSAQHFAEESPELRALLGRADADRASMARRRGLHAEAVQSYTRALRHFRVPDWLSWRAQAYLEIGDEEAALRDMSEQISLAPDDADAIRRRGKLLTALGRYDEALEDLNRALVLTPDVFRVRSDRAWLFLKRNEHEQAAREFRAALEIDPGHVWALETLRWLLCDKLRRPAESVPLLRRLIALEPDEAQHWHHLGDVFHALGDPEHVAAWRRYLELADPTDPEHREPVRVIRAYLERGV